MVDGRNHEGAAARCAAALLVGSHAAPHVRGMVGGRHHPGGCGALGRCVRDRDLPVGDAPLLDTALTFLLALTINLQHLRDFDNDAANGKRTTAVYLGKRGAEIYHYAITAAACACYLLFPVCLRMANPLNYLFVLAFIPLVIHCIDFHRVVHTPGSMARLDTLMSPLVRAMSYVAVLFCLCILL